MKPLAVEYFSGNLCIGTRSHSVDGSFADFPDAVRWIRY